MKTVWVLLLALFVSREFASGYAVAPALSLEKFAAEADVIFKATAVASNPVKDDVLKRGGDVSVMETVFRVISTIKGEALGSKILFRHYDDANPPPEFGFGNPSQKYHFEKNQTYIVFAKKTDKLGVYRQSWEFHKMIEDQGVLLCANNHITSGTEISEIIWNELAAALKAKEPSHVLYAISKLDQMSGGGRWRSTNDFDRTKVVNAVRELMTNNDPKVAQAAISVIGTNNPYLSDKYTPSWLATVGRGKISQYAEMDSKMKNVGGALYWKELEAIASRNAAVETRALAIRALGLIREPALRPSVNRWIADSNPAIRASAAVLLTDFPEAETNQQLTILANDTDPLVRAEVCRAIAYGQQDSLVSVLGKLLDDSEEKVRRVAYVCLLSFSPNIESVARLMQERLDSKFDNSFLNALAHDNPEPYLDHMVRALKTENKHIAGPPFITWCILFNHIFDQPEEAFASGKMDRYMEALENAGTTGSQEPRDLYALYLKKGLKERAQKIRLNCKEAGNDCEVYFNQVDANPSHYTNRRSH